VVEFMPYVRPKGVEPGYRERKPSDSGTTSDPSAAGGADSDSAKGD
jgi:hypothetical protein